MRLPSFQHSDSPSRGQQDFPLARRLIACALLCQSLAACAVATPLGEGIDAQPTGSILAPPPQGAAASHLPATLDEEDRRRVLGALAIALDPQGNGASVRWDNPVSKAHGQIAPIGLAYPSKDLICRKFSARFDSPAGARLEEGSACRDKSAEWKIAELKPAKAAPALLREAVLSPK
ncbi:RT0821/Lpp0805 family surface protein [Rhodoblastus sp.]|uniref:RT0821/Lpp0805 family surface protein n=1 Tax=Rhodoblastus sp. TaxID=1962975 RepID=UPI003F9DFEC7